jgi:Zn-dependent protease/CBS domain-containing protein
MGWSLMIGRIAGTAIRIHITFLIFIAWIWGASYISEGPAAAWNGLVFIILLFVCVLAHEFGHILAARAYGIETPDVTLLPIGGVARLARIPEEPIQELLIALAGPAVNVAIAVVLLVLTGSQAEPTQLAAVESSKFALADRLTVVNLFLALFNMIPAFPMDGGRVLRALLAIRLGYVRATKVAATIGQASAFVMGAIGLFYNPLLIFIALFVYFAASSEAHAAALRAMSQGIPVTSAMMTRYATLAPDTHIDEAVETLLSTSQSDFPVTDDGRLVGLLGRTDIVRALKQMGPDARVGQAMTTDIPVVDRTRRLDEALRILQEKSAPAVGIVDAGGRLVGLITTETLGEMMLIGDLAPNFRLRSRISAPRERGPTAL